MTQNDTPDPAETRADAGEPAAPPGAASKPRPKPLDSLERVRRELSSIYHQAKHGTMPMDKAKGLTYLLSQIAATLRAEAGSEPELVALLAAVRARLKE
jgi:hypothetical protein